MNDLSGTAGRVISFLLLCWAMPILFHEIQQNGAELGVWRVHEPEAWFGQQLEISEPERENLARLKSVRHRREWWASRLLLHRMSGREVRGKVLKDENGKPRLEDSEYEISLSHSGEFVAVLAAPFAVGIDIQRLVPKITRLAPKFMRPEESACLESDTMIEQLHVFWGAKESLYKAHAKRSLDFKTHILIDPFHYQRTGGSFRGRLNIGATERFFELQYRLIQNYVLVYAFETSDH